MDENFVGMGREYGFPALVVRHTKHSVRISCEGLSETLETYYNNGVYQVDAVVELNRKRFVITCSIYKKVDKRTGHVYYWLYPLGAGQLLLKKWYRIFRGASGRYAKTPMPTVIYSVTPKTAETTFTP